VSGVSSVGSFLLGHVVAGTASAVEAKELLKFARRLKAERLPNH
jgi:hypothetical protein